MSLYRKYRPQTFGEIIGQESVVKVLLRQLESGNINHAYLFSGSRGTGKTSTARIFAKALNCKKYSGNKFGEPCNKCENCLSITAGSYMDVLEIDAASNRGIDEIRDLRDKIRLAPTVGQYKVYIIDEVHMLTNEAFNALLKTLEEPPEHAIFVLATTEIHKIPATILSRTQKFEFNLSGKVTEKLIKIKEASGMEKESLALIAKLSGGSFRDAETLLEKVLAANSKPTLEEVEVILGNKRISGIHPFDLFLYKKTKEAIVWLEKAGEEGGNYKVLAESLVEVLRDLLLIKVGALTAKESSYNPEVFQELESFSQQIPKDKLTQWIRIFSAAMIEMKDSPIPSLPLELAIVEACEFQDGLIEEEKAVKVVVEAIKAPPKKEIPLEPIVEVKAVKSDNLSQPTITEAKKVRSFALDDLQKNWVAILEAIKSQNNSLAIFLRGAKPMDLEGDLLMIEVSYQFHKDRLEEPKNAKLLSETIASILGKPVRIKGVVGEKKIKPMKTEQIEEVDPVEIFGKLV